MQCVHALCWDNGKKLQKRVRLVHAQIARLHGGFSSPSVLNHRACPNRARRLVRRKLQEARTMQLGVPCRTQMIPPCRPLPAREQPAWHAWPKPTRRCTTRVAKPNRMRMPAKSRTAKSQRKQDTEEGVHLGSGEGGAPREGSLTVQVEGHRVFEPKPSLEPGPRRGGKLATCASTRCA